MSVGHEHPEHGQMRHVHRGGVPVGEPRSVLTRPLVWVIRLYQLTISVILGPVCRYYPSCSAYGVTALERHGLLRGSWLTVRRVLRCHPWAAGGVDHVPPRVAGTAPPQDRPASGDRSGTTTTTVSAAHRRH